MQSVSVRLRPFGDMLQSSTSRPAPCDGGLWLPESPGNQQFFLVAERLSCYFDSSVIELLTVSLLLLSLPRLLCFSTVLHTCHKDILCVFINPTQVEQC